MNSIKLEGSSYFCVSEDSVACC